MGRDRRGKADGSVGEAAYGVAPVCVRIDPCTVSDHNPAVVSLPGRRLTWALYSVSAEEEHGFLKCRDPAVTGSSAQKTR